MAAELEVAVRPRMTTFVSSAQAEDLLTLFFSEARPLLLEGSWLQIRVVEDSWQTMLVVEPREEGGWIGSVRWCGLHGDPKAPGGPAFAFSVLEPDPVAVLAAIRAVVVRPGQEEEVGPVLRALDQITGILAKEDGDADRARH